MPCPHEYLIAAIDWPGLGNDGIICNGPPYFLHFIIFSRVT